MKKFLASVMLLSLGAVLPLNAADSAPQKKTAAPAAVKPSATVMEASPEAKALMKKFEASWHEADEQSKNWAKLVQQQELDKEKRDKELTSEYLRQVKRRSEIDEQTLKQMQAFYTREDAFFKQREKILLAQQTQSDRLDALLKKWEDQTKRYEELLAKSDRLGMLLQKWEDQARRYDVLLEKWETRP